MSGQQADRIAAAQAATAPRVADGVRTKVTSRSVEETLAALSRIVTDKGMKIFAVIDHSGEAAQAGLELRETKVVIFGNPKAGTAVMAAAPLAALDMPLKVLIWSNNGQTTVTYTAPAALAARYGLSEDLAARLAGIDGLTDALVAG